MQTLAAELQNGGSMKRMKLVFLMIILVGTIILLGCQTAEIETINTAIPVRSFTPSALSSIITVTSTPTPLPTELRYWD
jgi:hypothetical protein